MRIRRLVATNYRGLPSLDLAFDEQFTVIAGVNGRGKTGMLDLLARMLNLLMPQISSARRTPTLFQITDVRDGEQEMSANLYLRMARDIPINFRCGVSLTRTPAFEYEKLPGMVRRAVRNGYGPDMDTDTDAAPLAIYYTTDRAGFQLPKKLPEKLARNQAMAYQNALIQRTVNFREIVSQLLKEIIVEEDRQTENAAFLGENFLDAVRQCLAVFLPEVTRVEAEQSPYRLRIYKGTTPLNLQQLSDGERNLLAMMLDMVRRLALANPKLDNPLQGSAVVLIDELELHLHPNWQRNITDNLIRIFPNIQFIGTTHSPYVGQALKQGQLYSLDGPIENIYENQGIEEVSRFALKVDTPEMSVRYRRMLEVSDRYFEILESPDNIDTSELRRLESELEDLTQPYNNDPVFHAFLKRKRLAAGLEE